LSFQHALTASASFSVPFDLIYLICIPQAEVVIQFLMGTLDISDTYCDDMGKIAYKYVTAPAGFWLDVITSLPWSFNDLYSSQVPGQNCYIAYAF
jgi:hypothetical protein